jgi:hypothetical protein
VKLCPVMFRSAVVAVDPETGRAKVEDWLQCRSARSKPMAWSEQENQRPSPGLTQQGRHE